MSRVGALFTYNDVRTCRAWAVSFAVVLPIAHIALFRMDAQALKSDIAEVSMPLVVSAASVRQLRHGVVYANLAGHFGPVAAVFEDAPLARAIVLHITKLPPRNKNANSAGDNNFASTEYDSDGDTCRKGSSDLHVHNANELLKHGVLQNRLVWLMSLAIRWSQNVASLVAIIPTSALQ